MQHLHRNRSVWQTDWTVSHCSVKIFPFGRLLLWAYFFVKRLDCHNHHPLKLNHNTESTRSFILCGRTVNRNIHTYEADGMLCKYSIFWHLTNCSRSSYFPTHYGMCFSWSHWISKCCNITMQGVELQCFLAFLKQSRRFIGHFCSVWPIQVLWDWGLKAGPVRSLEKYI